MNWPAMLRAALRLGVAPEAFWRLSLKEWRALAGPEPGGALSRIEFERLAEEHPDDR